MRIYYRGYVISEDAMLPGCTVEGQRPERAALTHHATSRAAMQWIDRDVFYRKVADAGWLPPQTLSA